MKPVLPKAWMGYASAWPTVTIRVCAWCADKAEAEREAEAAGFGITHGICPQCAQQQMSRYLGERQP